MYTQELGLIRLRSQKRQQLRKSSFFFVSLIINNVFSIMAKEDGRKNNGGHANSGRKSKAEELKARTKIKQALKVIYNEDSEDEAELAFLVEFAQTKDGMKFCAEHLLGKAPNKVDVTTDGEQMNNPLIMFGKE